MTIGYARVSTIEQDISLQINSLKDAGCEKIFEEVSDEECSEREQFNKMLFFLRENDTIIVHRICRITKFFEHLTKLIDLFDKKKIELVFLTGKFTIGNSSENYVMKFPKSQIDYKENEIETNTVTEKKRRYRKFKNLSDEGLLIAEKIWVMCVKERKTMVEISKILDLDTPTCYKYLKSIENIKKNENEK